MSRKKTRLYDTVPIPSRLNGPIKGLTIRNPIDPICYTWYCLSDAVIDAKGQLLMRNAGVSRDSSQEGGDLIHHWCGNCTIAPDHPDYEKFRKAIEEAQKPEW